MIGGWLPQDRAERIGLIASVGGHLALLLWALLGGIFFSHDNPPATMSTNVSLMSSKDFAALEAQAPKAATESPPQPSAPKASKVPPPSPKTDKKPEETQPVEPAPETTPDAAPDTTELAPVETQVTDAPPTETSTPTPDSLSQIPDTPTDTPQPKAAEIVAPDPSKDTPPEADTADQTQEATTDAPAPDQPKDKPEDATAPKDTGEVLLTEDNKDKEVATAAPTQSPRPAKKPEKPVEPAPQETAAAEPADTQAASDAPATDATDAAVNDALAEALSGEASDTPTPGTGGADQGPPMTSGEKDALVVAVKQCWNVGSLSTDALHTVVTISVSMGQDGKPDAGSIKMIGFEGGDDAAAQQAFEAGRRAIIRCAKNGYDLPPEKYEQWKEIEIVFNPEKMRLR